MGNMRISNKINVIVALFATRLSIGRELLDRTRKI